MFIEMKNIVVKPGFGKMQAEKFMQGSVVQEQPGFVKLEAGYKTYPDKEDVIVIIYWQSHDDFLNWKKSDAHIAGHKNRKGVPEHILERSSRSFELL